MAPDASQRRRHWKKILENITVDNKVNNIAVVFIVVHVVCNEIDYFSLASIACELLPITELGSSSRYITEVILTDAFYNYAFQACVSAVVVCLLVYTISANYGYLTFGSLVDGDVLLSYDATKIQVLLALILLALKSWTTYPILMFCVR